MIFLRIPLLLILSFIIAFSSLGMEIVKDQSEKTGPVFEPLPMLEFSDHLGDRISFVAYSPDGTMILIVSHENVHERFFVTVWDSQNGERLYTIKHSSSIFCAKFSSDSSKILTASYDGTATIRNAKNGNGEIKLEHKGLTVADVSHDGKKVVTSAPNDPVKIWDAEVGMVLIELQKPDAFYQIFFSPNDNKLIAITWRQLLVLDTDDGKAYCVETHGGRAETFSFDRKQLILIDSLTIKLVDIVGGKILSTLNKDSKSFGNEWNRFEFFNINSANSIVVVSLAHNNMVSEGLKTIRTLREPILPGYKSENTYILFTTPSSDGQLLITASYNHIARIWHIPSGTLLCSIIGFTPPPWSNGIMKEGLQGDIREANFSPDNKTIIIGHTNGMARVYLMPPEEMLAYQNGKTEKLKFKIYFDLLSEYIILAKEKNRKKSYNDFIRFMCIKWKANDIKKVAIDEVKIFDNLSLHTQDYLRLLIPNRPEPIKDIIN